MVFTAAHIALAQAVRRPAGGSYRLRRPRDSPPLGGGEEARAGRHRRVPCPPLDRAGRPLSPAAAVAETDRSSRRNSSSNTRRRRARFSASSEAGKWMFS